MLVGTAGVRVDRPLGQVALTVSLVAATLAAHWAAAIRGHAVACAVAAGVFYYGGNALVCARRVNVRLRARFGATTAVRAHEVFLGVAFANQALAITATAAVGRGELPLPAGVGLAAGAVLTVVGAVTKYWATALTGLDVYYYRDLFLRRRLGTLVTKGPYHKLRHPMYGLGNAHAYAPALAAGSVVGLLVAFAYHVAIYAFLFAVEKPFVARLVARERLDAGAATGVPRVVSRAAAATPPG